MVIADEVTITPPPYMVSKHLYSQSGMLAPPATEERLHFTRPPFLCMNMNDSEALNQTLYRYEKVSIRRYSGNVVS